MSIDKLKFKECPACGNVFIPVHRRYCSDCMAGIKAKQRYEDKLERRVTKLEKQIATLKAKK
ncbi:MAG: hypothetical protein OIN85_00905 [Candidatus Methanoperedens sp.]|nr:hypothetical protein [Candidatus Methanoperedens sp.]